MEFLIEIVGGLIEEAFLELGFRALFGLPRFVCNLRDEPLQTVFARHSLD